MNAGLSTNGSRKVTYESKKVVFGLGGYDVHS